MNKKIIKVCIFDKDSTPSQVIKSNGDAILDNICIKCETDEHLETGEYYLDAIFLLDDKGLYKYIHEEAILKVSLDYGDEYFRIAKIKRNRSDITVFARQETIHQTLHMWLSDVRPENQNGQGALSWIKDNSVGPKDITVSSDINKINTSYYMDMNMYQSLHDCDQSFKNRWGGEIQRRGYNLRINKRIGTHRGVQIRSRKNLTGFEANTDIDNVFTRIKPKGFDGITIDGFVDSHLIDKYPFIKTIEIKYDDVKVKDENNQDEGYDTLEEAQKELIRRAGLEFTEKHIDSIRADYRVNFIQLEQTEEYKNYVVAERVYLGDEIDVYEDKLDINIIVRAIRRKFDVLRKRVIEVELSNEVVKKTPPSIGDIIDKVDKFDDEYFDDILNQAKDHATDLINAGLKDSYVVVRKNEILIMDTQDINTAINVWRWNRNGLGFSNTGYHGQYGTAITNDGKIVADFITTGVLNGNLIKAGIISGRFIEANTVSAKEIIIGTSHVDANRIKSLHSDGSYTEMNSREFHATNINGVKTVSTRRGGIWNYDARNGKVIGTIGASNTQSGVGLSCVGSRNNSHYISIGSGDNFTTDDSIVASQPNILCVYNKYGTSAIENTIGTHLLTHNVYIWTKLILKYMLEMDSGSSYPHQIYNSSGKLAIHGDNGVQLGVRAGSDKYKNLMISEDSSGAKGYFDSWGHWDFHSWTMRNMNTAYSLIPQSNQLKKNIYHQIFELYGVNSFNKDEFTYTVSETQRISYGESELMIEIPQILAENMQLDYHINISKISFGDYRIKEKTPYYFIIETDKIYDSFNFTFQIIGKLIEKADNQEFISGRAIDLTSINDDYNNVEPSNHINQANNLIDYWKLYRKDV